MLSTHSVKVTATHLPPSSQEYVYVLAGTELAFSHQVPRLQSFFVGCRVLNGDSPRFNFPDAGLFTLCYHGTAPFANTLRDVKFFRYKRFVQLNIDDVPACQISLNDSRINVINNSPFDSPINLELLTGPALIILMAQNGVFCLHAGAVATAVGNIAIIAESGAGKSTLSKHVDSRWTQLADDIQPILGASLLPDFPQLKLPNARSQGQLGADTTLKAILRVQPMASTEIQFKRLNSVEALLQVVRHTVATKLFDGALLSAQMSFAKKLVSVVPVIELSYPRDVSQLAELRRAITRYLESLE